MKSTLEPCKLTLISDVFYKFMQNLEKSSKTFVRVFGTLTHLFQINTLSISTQDDYKRSEFLTKIKAKLKDFIDNELIFGLLEYKDSYLLVNLDTISKSSNFIINKRYFFLGEIISLNDILFMMPTTSVLLENDFLELSLYEKAVEVFHSKIYSKNK